MDKEQLKEKLKEIGACTNARLFCDGKTLAESWRTCERGDWMLWLYARATNYDIHKLHLAKGYCAQTVIHLMKDERSKKAVQATIDFGNVNITTEELKAAYAAAADAAYAYAADAADAYAAAYADADDAYAAAAAAAYAYAADAYAAAYAAAADDAAAYAADAYAYAAAAYAAAYAAAADDAAAYAAAAKKENQLKTADICRKYLPIPTF